jgi:hypothetical protein
MRSIDDRTNRRLIITLLEEYFNTAVVSEPFERFFGETVLTHMRTLSVSEEHWNRVMETLTTETTLVATADPEVTAALEATAAPEATAGAVPAEVVRPGHGTSDAVSSLTGSPTRGENGAVAERDIFGEFFEWLVTGIRHNWSMVTGALPFRGEAGPVTTEAGAPHDEAGSIGGGSARDEAGSRAEARASIPVPQ